MLRPILPLLIVLTACASAATDPSTRQATNDLNNAAAAWESGDRSDYSYSYTRTCDCPEPEPQGPNTVFVVDGQVTSVEHFGAREALDGFAIDDLFTRIRQAIEDAKPIAVVYDTATGMPLTINLDLDATAGSRNGPLILELSSFLSYPDERRELSESLHRWETAQLSSYRLRYDSHGSETTIVDVIDGVAAEGPPTLAPRTVQQFFDEITEALEGRPDHISIGYDPILGYPTSYRIIQDSSLGGGPWITSIVVTN